jgi:hypothetical protein
MRLTANEELIALAEPRDGRLKPVVGFSPPVPSR